MDEEIAVIMSYIHQGIIQYIQLHGKESEEYIMRLKQQTAIPVIKAYQLGMGCYYEEINHTNADSVLLDSGAGSGEVFDWSILAGIRVPYILAGGIGMHNVDSAIKLTGPYSLDISSGAEVNGKKDYEKMKQLIERIHRRKGTEM